MAQSGIICPLGGISAENQSSNFFEVDKGRLGKMLEINNQKASKVLQKGIKAGIVYE